MNQLRQLAGQTAIYGLSSVIGRLLNYLLVPLHTRIFLPEKFGVVSELYAYVSFLAIILTYGMETGFFRFASDNKNFGKVYGTALISLFSTSTLFVILVTVFANPIAGWLKYPQHPEYVIWFGIILATDAIVSIPFAKLRQQNKAKRFAAIKLINIIANIVFNLFFLVVCPWLIKSNPDSICKLVYSPDVGVGYIFIANLIANIITLIILIPDIFNVKISFDKKLLKEILIYSFPLLIAGLAGMVNETMDRIFLKNYLPGELHERLGQIGIYSANYKIAILMTVFIQMFRYAAEPFFFKHAKDKDAKQMYAGVMKYFVIFGLFIFLGVMMYIDIVKFFIGEKYYSGLKIVPIVLLANLCLGVYYNLSIWYKLTNKTRWGAYISVVGAIITIVLNLWLIPTYGYIVSAWATLACYFSMMALSYLSGQKFYPINYDLPTLFGYFVLAIVLYFVSIILHFESLPITLTINTIIFFLFVSFIVYIEKLHLVFKKTVT